MALARVQATGKVVADATTSIALTFGSPPALGNGIVVAIITNNAAGNLTGCADNRSNTYFLAKAQTVGDGKVWIFYAPLVTTSSAPFTITVTAGASTYLVATAIEVSGVGTGLGIDQSAGQSSSGTAVATTATAALTVDEAFLVAAESVDGAQGSITVQSVSPSWTQEAEELSFSHAVGEINSRVVTGALGTTASCSWTNASNFTWSAAVVAFKADRTPGIGLLTTPVRYPRRCWRHDRAAHNDWCGSHHLECRVDEHDHDRQ